jgi:hypothetical protein
MDSAAAAQFHRALGVHEVEPALDADSPSDGLISHAQAHLGDVIGQLRIEVVGRGL